MNRLFGQGWLTATLSKEVFGIVVSLAFTIEVWHVLVHAFACISSDRSLALKQQLTSINCGSNALSVYLQKFKTICDNLKAIANLYQTTRSLGGF